MKHHGIAQVQRCLDIATQSAHCLRKQKIRDNKPGDHDAERYDSEVIQVFRDRDVLNAFDNFRSQRFGVEVPGQFNDDYVCLKHTNIFITMMLKTQRLIEDGY